MLPMPVYFAEIFLPYEKHYMYIIGMYPWHRSFAKPVGQKKTQYELMTICINIGVESST